MRFLKSLLLASGLVLALAVPAQAQPAKRAVLQTYADMANAMYGDAHDGAVALRAAIAKLVAEPSDDTLKAARAAWLAGRVPYSQSEIYRFGNEMVDEWEGKVNAWPLDEGLIDYVNTERYGDQSAENPLFTANIIAASSISHAGERIDVGRITQDALNKLHEIGSVEANVSIGWHAIEFLLWGQDLNGTGPGAGNRPYTDYVQGPGCTGGNCARRAEYLTVIAAMLVERLAEMRDGWAAGGAARKALSAKGADGGLAAILTGLGSLAYGELAGERMKLGLILHDPEEEQDCFSDNTHNSHYNNVMGMRAVYFGVYRRANGSELRGPALGDFVKAGWPTLDREMRARLDATLTAFQTIKTRAETVEAYDQMLGDGNQAGNAVVQAGIDALIAQTRTLEKIIAGTKLKVSIDGSDSLDDPAKVRK